MAKKFDRALRRDLLSRDQIAEYPLWQQILEEWAPSGTQSHNGDHLRLCVRQGYLNAYSCGQSLFKVTLGRRAPTFRFDIHEKYIDPELKDSKRMKRVDGTTRQGEFFDWIENSKKHRNAEKRFVDQLVTANPDIIDLECALPALGMRTGKDNKLVVPRIDLVGLEASSGSYQLVLWEAKLSDNGEARKSGDAEPDVSAQLEKYKQWLLREGHEDMVLEAYRENCKLLVTIHEIARELNPEIGGLAPSIHAVADDPAVLTRLDPEIRLVFDDTGAHGRSASPSFVENGHLAKLRRFRQSTCLIGAGDSYVLKTI